MKKLQSIPTAVVLIVLQATLAMGQVKWVQLPDGTPTGMDIRIDRTDGVNRVLADDFLCTTAGPITDVHFWGSWKNDNKGNILKIHLSIHKDIPADPCDPDSYSKPGGLLWEMNFNDMEFTETLYTQLPDDKYEWWWDVYSAAVEPNPNGDQQIWQYDIYIGPNDAFVQEGSVSDPLVYWLDIYVETELGIGSDFGWKTSWKHWNDDAVYWDTGSAPGWAELIYPSKHPYAPNSIDMAFVIGTKEIVEPNEACCFPDGSCLDLTPAECFEMGGIPHGSGTDCTSTECPPEPEPNEACCLPDGSCVDVTAALCHMLLGGTPQGSGTDCSGVNCPQPCALDPVACPTGDESVMIAYMAGFSDNFGPMPDPAPLPDAILLNYIIICSAPGVPLQFDEVPGEGVVPANSWFGHTFSGLPSGIVAARLQLRARATASGGSGGLFNDHISIVDSIAGCTPSWAWSSRFENLPEAGGDWTVGEVATFCLDLEALPTQGGPVSVLNQLNTGSLSILIDDDTGVDWVRLTIAVCPCEYHYPAEVTAGEDDDCEFTPPIEQASPSTELATAFGNPWRNFDQIIPNRKFGHTFTGLPPGIVAAELEICLRAGDGGCTNDNFHLEFRDLNNPTFVWGRRIHDLPLTPGGTPIGSWNNGDVATFTLDLDDLVPSNANVTSVLGDLADGDLDIYIQDDTAVDYIILRYWRCCEKAVSGDINFDGIVNFGDFAILADHWLEIDPLLGCQGCP